MNWNRPLRYVLQYADNGTMEKQYSLFRRLHALKDLTMGAGAGKKNVTT